MAFLFYACLVEQQRNAAIVDHRLTPSGKESGLLIWAPIGLMMVKIGGAKLRNLMGDGVIPCGMMLKITPAIDGVAQQWPRMTRRCGLL